MKRSTTRRDFLKGTTVAGLGFFVAARTSFAETKSPNEKLDIGIIGCGGKGSSDMEGCSNENIVALCDVDENQAADARKKYPDAKFYLDFREMLEKEKSLDAVTVSTADHMHAVAGVMAMEMGKHVYCQKPLTHTVHEARAMREAAKKYKVATQMGNQGSAEPGLRRAVECLQAGVIGPVREIHVWSNRPIWPQGIDRPEGSKPVPAHLKWDLWLGVAPDRPYNDGYHPFNWRGWWDFGTGALGDMACHTCNMPFRALKLGYPKSVEAETSGFNSETYPKQSKIKFEFPAREGLPELAFWWYDGGVRPPAEITKELRRVPGSGCMLIGDKGKLYSPDDYGSTFRLYPEKDFEGYQGPPETIERLAFNVDTDRAMKLEWIRAIRGGPPAYSNFDIAAYLTEIILLGNIAMRVGKKIEWDGPNMKATNCPEAEEFVKVAYRSGYTL